MYLFADRREAGALLADRLAGSAAGVLVLGLPRGGVPVAAEVASRLGAELDALTVRKLGAPGQPEYAIGAIASGGIRIVNEPAVLRLGLAPDVVDAIADSEGHELARREHAYRGDRPPPAVAGREVIVVDDGLATGATMVAAVRAMRSAGAARVTAAVPVASGQGAQTLRPEVDALVCLAVPDGFMAVGPYYRDFGATTDDEVRGLLSPV
ncbi:MULTISPECIES: phosphoribosyltransferase [unclassified Parafrankia]|uniref:phosphoribosyltransferase n=1 Tax=unclassified Parafrankia TaxID=2994368 RepID=UPI000DA446D2|nr:MULTISPECIES: phosphoribosyltransferase family protein [unclassified Parafrankia]TCJ38546.1 phosphoribosyltransferase [Parafrankia sp. BMG5.11]SQD95248.1 Phosphoribosyltransferase [Parafrankia sp. Ea1.12]